MDLNQQYQKIGIIGLGNMGNAMARTLIREGFLVVGTDLGEVQKKTAKAIGVEVVDDIKALCSQTKNIILSLPMAKHVVSVIKGEEQGLGGIIEYAQPDTLVIDTSTSEPSITKQLAVLLANKGHQLLDCPVSGGPAGAANGSMVVVAGGESSALERAQPWLDALSSKVVHLGASGNGHTAKLINNLLCAAHLVTTAEAIALGKKAGLDPAALIEGLNAGSGRSAISEVNFPRWILNERFDSGFSMQLMRKDVRLAKQLIKDMQMQLSMSEAVADIWAASEDCIADADDFNSIVKSHI